MLRRIFNIVASFLSGIRCPICATCNVTIHDSKVAKANQEMILVDKGKAEKLGIFPPLEIYQKNQMGIISRPE